MSNYPSMDHVKSLRWRRENWNLVPKFTLYSFLVSNLSHYLLSWPKWSVMSHLIEKELLVICYNSVESKIHIHNTVILSWFCTSIDFSLSFHSLYWQSNLEVKRSIFMNRHSYINMAQGNTTINHHYPFYILTLSQRNISNLRKRIPQTCLPV